MSIESKKARARARRRKFGISWEHMAGEYRPAPLANAWEGVVHTNGPVAFPILQWSRQGNEYLIDPGEQGSAFFVTMGDEGGLFLTAKHVVQKHSPEAPFSVIVIDTSAQLTNGRGRHA